MKIRIRGDWMLLVRPNHQLKDKIISFKNDFTMNDEKIINGSELLDKMDSFDEWFEYVSNNASIDTLSEDWVLTDIYFAIVGEKIVGVICLRHYLNDFLFDFGHIAYSVCPSERRRGYATKMLELVLDNARDIGMLSVKISTFHDNIASVKAIIKNGGVYDYGFIYEDNIVDVYLIKL